MLANPLRGTTCQTGFCFQAAFTAMEFHKRSRQRVPRGAVRARCKAAIAATGGHATGRSSSLMTRWMSAKDAFPLGKIARTFWRLARNA